MNVDEKLVLRMARELYHVVVCNPNGRYFADHPAVQLLVEIGALRLLSPRFAATTIPPWDGEHLLGSDSGCGT